MTITAIIGGSGVTHLQNLQVVECKQVVTPYGAPSADIVLGKLGDADFAFLARHGNPHTIPPHKINYRANIWALHECGVQQIVAIAAVGGINEKMPPASLVIPDQIIDYSYGREHTFFADELTEVKHIDFSWPYTQTLRLKLLQAASESDVAITDGGTYGCTQGPRLESAAEIRRMRQDGCDLVGMTGMPEAALARELDIPYACCSLIVNWAAGMTDEEISMREIEDNLAVGLQKVRVLLNRFVP